jgi:hypothetical protein
VRALVATPSSKTGVQVSAARVADVVIDYDPPPADALQVDSDAGLAGDSHFQLPSARRTASR